jgi:hypothetical protein
MKKSGNVVQIQFRTTEANHAWLKAKAESLDRSVNWVLNRAVDEARDADFTSAEIARPQEEMHA